MSLVAVVTRPSDRPGQLPETRIVAVGMPQDTAFGAYFPTRMMARAQMIAGECLLAGSQRASEDMAMVRSSVRLPVPHPGAVHQTGTIKVEGALSPGLFRRLFSGGKTTAKASAETAKNVLLDLASRMDSDGGMPGNDSEARASASLIALLAFLSQGHTRTRGAFRGHVARLVSFLQSATGLSNHQERIVAAVLELARKDKTLPGDWIELARTPGDHWIEVERGARNAQGA
jgi:hypothetical protein